MLKTIALDSTRLQRLQQTPLWDFAIALYAKPGVEEACLSLQEEAGLDVCEVLFHCWLYASGLEATPSALAHQREQRRLWQCQVTEVLRGLRRDLKAAAASNDSVKALRESIKQAELMAERENLQRWQTWACEAQNHEQRVANIADMPQDVANWLLNQLLFSQSADPSSGGSNEQNGCFHSLQTLTYQLDPQQGAR